LEAVKQLVFQFINGEKQKSKPLADKLTRSIFLSMGKYTQPSGYSSFKVRKKASFVYFPDPGIYKGLD